MVGGVAGGLSAHFGIDATLIRIVFALLSFAGGSGFAVYVAAWLLIPRAGEQSSLARRALADRRAIVIAGAFAIGVGVVLLTLSALGLPLAAGLIWPVTFGAAGLVVAWRVAEGDERAFLRELVEQTPLLGPGQRPNRAGTTARVVVGSLLIAVGLGGLASTRHPSFATVAPLFLAGVVIAGFLSCSARGGSASPGSWPSNGASACAPRSEPTWRRTVHDSVLQTLALIQRSAGDPARSPAWPGPGAGAARLVVRRPAAGSFDAVERRRPSAEAVAVHRARRRGDPRRRRRDGGRRRLPARPTTLARPARRRRARRRSTPPSGRGRRRCRCIVEVEPTRVSLFVRDRGTGFDPDAVAADRRASPSRSEARMARHGARAIIRSAPGEGTEVELVMPRAERPA